MMKILLLDNYDSFTHNLYHALENIGGCEVDVVRNDKIAIEDVERYDRILLSPGPGIPEEAGLMPQIIERYKDSKNILGVCLGHQALAECFGGKLLNLERVMHGKESEIELKLEEEPIFDGLDKKIVVGRYHSWVVGDEDLPDCFVVTARDAGGQIMAMRHKELPLRGVQFHPESIMTPDGDAMLKNWIGA